MGGLTSISGHLTTQPVSARQTTDASNAVKVTIALLGDLCRVVSSSYTASRLPKVMNQKHRVTTAVSWGDWRCRALLTRSLARGWGHRGARPPSRPAPGRSAAPRPSLTGRPAHRGRRRRSKRERGGRSLADSNSTSHPSPPASVAAMEELRVDEAAADPHVRQQAPVLVPGLRIEDQVDPLAPARRLL